MTQTIISILGVLITIFFVVGTHEYAHFIVARWLNVKVLRFSIGFGRTLYQWKGKKGTEYVVALIPLGGYVQMLDENEGNVPKEELHLAFNRQPFYKKFLIVLAGPAMNLLCALVLYWIIFMMGFETIKPVIGEIKPNSIAAVAGLQKNTEIIGVDNGITTNWMSIIFRTIIHAGDDTTLSMQTTDLAGKHASTHILNLASWEMDSLNPDPLGSLGITPYEPAIPLIIGAIGPNTPAAASPLQIGDKIIAVDSMKIKDWAYLINIIKENPDKPLTFLIERNGKIKSFAVTIGSKHNLFLQKSGQLGIAPKIDIPKELLRKIQFGPVEAFTHAAKEIGDFTYYNLVLFEKIITGKISVRSLGGPITIFESAGSAINYGLLPFLGFLAFLSVAIGVINLLPIPGLDGGHLFVQLIEFVIRRPVPEKVLMVFYRIGIFIIVFVLIQAVVNDVARMW